MNPYLVTGLSLAPVVFERLLNQVPASRLDETIVADRFSPREIIAHLADWEPIMRKRIEQACAKPGSVVSVFDEGEMAVAHQYAESDPRTQLDLFRREREITVNCVLKVSPEQWGNVISHPERGSLSADDLANLLVGHDMYHIEQLSAYLPQSS